MIEIQIVPSDIRRSVRYMFLDRGRVLASICVLAVVLAAVIGSMAAAPTVIRRVYRDNYVRSMRSERDIQKERLRENIVQMNSLERSVEDQSLRVAKLITVYGLERNLGQGGFSFPLSHATGDPASVQLDEASHREAALQHAMAHLQQQIDLISRYELENADLVRHTPSILPVPADQFVMTSPFGMRLSPFTRLGDFHKGIDLAAPTGTPVYAAADGVVSFAGWVPLRDSVNWWRFGNVVVIKHSERFMTIYGHCNSIKVQRGEHVRQGQMIASVGSTGWSTNSHLHYEVRSDLEHPGTYAPIDPRIYILNYQWSNEANLLARSRSSREYKGFDPLPSAFLGKAKVKVRGRRRV